MTEPNAPQRGDDVRPTAVVDRRFLLTVLGLAGLAIVPAACGADAQRPAAGSSSGAAASSSTTTSSGTSVTAAASSQTVPATTSTAPRRLARGELDAAVVKALGNARDSVGVSVIDRRTGARYSRNGTVPFEMASTTKVLILAAFLRARREDGGRLSRGDRGRVSAMIRYSDNNAATSLRAAAGGAEGVARMARDIGMRQTADSAESVYAWGSVHTTSDEQAQLMSVIADGGKGLLDAEDCRYILDEMRHVTPEQRWGVGSLTAPDVSVAVKNGWLPSGRYGRWAVNSIGLVQGAGRDFVLTMYEHDLRDEGVGIEHKNAVARAVHEALAVPLAAS